MAFFRPFALERFFSKHEFSARYMLCASDCESMPVGELLAMEPGASERLCAMRMGYTETRGAPSLRVAIASLYGNAIGEAGIFVHAGAEEAILNLCLAVLGKGDRVIVNTPCYQSLSEIPAALGCEVRPWPLHEVSCTGGSQKSGSPSVGSPVAGKPATQTQATQILAAGVPASGDQSRPDRRWTLDPDELPGLAGGQARLIVLNMPHNPTGALLTTEEFNAVVAYARRTGALLLVDEVYRRLEHDPARQLPSVSEVYENGIALDVLSKHAGLPGLRIGWLASPRADILDAVAQIKDYNSICASGPSEFLAELAVRNLASIVERNRTIVQRNLALLQRFFVTHGDFAQWTPPEGGSIAFPRLCDGSDAELLADRLVAESGVLLLPGKYYDTDPARFRIGYGRANMPEVLSRLEAWLER
jgi:aspartate/methionine/tyrosine aminotransferase